MAINPQALRDEVEASVLEIGKFVETDEFQELLTDLWNTPREERSDFVRDVVLDDAELERRGIDVPEGMIIQRSAFEDGRPTLFCVSKYLSDGKRKVTITFDNF